MRSGIGAAVLIVASVGGGCTATDIRVINCSDRPVEVTLDEGWRKQTYVVDICGAFEERVRGVGGRARVRIHTRCHEVADSPPATQTFDIGTADGVDTYLIRPADVNAVTVRYVGQLPWRPMYVYAE